jgi:hypothetical protein
MHMYRLNFFLGPSLLPHPNRLSNHRILMEQQSPFCAGLIGQRSHDKRRADEELRGGLKLIEKNDAIFYISYC